METAGKKIVRAESNSSHSSISTEGSHSQYKPLEISLSGGGVYNRLTQLADDHNNSEESGKVCLKCGMPYLHDYVYRHPFPEPVDSQKQSGIAFITFAGSKLLRKVRSQTQNRPKSRPQLKRFSKAKGGLPALDTSFGQMGLAHPTPPRKKQSSFHTYRKIPSKSSMVSISAASTEPRSNYRSKNHVVPQSQAPFAEISQGNHSPFSHNGIMSHAFDIALPMGTPILATREGIVVDLCFHFTKGGIDQKYRHTANYVVIRHEDNSYARYYHVKHNSVCVKIGDYVEQGQMIARCGSTGFSRGPHLHFDVSKSYLTEIGSLQMLVKSNVKPRRKSQNQLAQEIETDRHLKRILSTPKLQNLTRQKITRKQSLQKLFQRPRAPASAENESSNRKSNILGYDLIELPCSVSNMSCKLAPKEEFDEFLLVADPSGFCTTDIANFTETLRARTTQCERKIALLTNRGKLSFSAKADVIAKLNKAALDAGEEPLFGCLIIVDNSRDMKHVIQNIGVVDPSSSEMLKANGSTSNLIAILESQQNNLEVLTYNFVVLFVSTVIGRKMAEQVTHKDPKERAKITEDVFVRVATHQFNGEPERYPYSMSITHPVHFELDLEEPAPIPADEDDNDVSADQEDRF